MAQRPKGCKSKVMAADGYVDTDPKNVYDLVITATGATAGDIVVLRDGGPTGTVKMKFIIPAAAGIWPVPFGRYGREFLTSVYYSELATAANKIVTNVGYD
jgi:hypothetical protein